MADVFRREPAVRREGHMSAVNAKLRRSVALAVFRVD
jgi:hypothetical protein